MIRNMRDKSKLTILLTTHYMDEADKLCDRIAIVDHGKLAALDTPTALKDSVPGTDSVEAEFEDTPPDWLDQLQHLAQSAGVTTHAGAVRIASHDGPATVAALMDLARVRHVTVKKVSVTSTTLDDVFLHYTGSELRDAAHGGAGYDISHLYR
jgi:ABC-2 type transport system ATP-binding protein